ncbi:MAG: SusD/RagB family nutrient-binding outer membrane lipoprotein [Chitinophaga sp.]|uniref:SusD/RagB family nutrient-binding outer membrane lipoprotein n=1 Tax=Chitinophaga sp. TaxID=1869181 RepID=UPI0025B823AF|nr:SusD/RagB family nutrient-binding outer membrane lipoprotein [Chitinophaga sp.]MBV8253513.1 SusD/RagB family nutrient-binding outer membrane lipoprotein [Chitinophaga sp.]
MKKIFVILGMSIAFTSCKKWLDVNNNPNNPTVDVPSAEQRLPAIIRGFADAYESAGTRTSLLTQQVGVYYASTNNWDLSRWYSNASTSNWPWQGWYVYTASNFDPLFAAAKKVEAWHYIGAGLIIKAWGFGTMADLYGMMPYDEFGVPSIYTPKFDDGEYVQAKVMALLDEGIANLQKQQGPAAPALSKADVLNNGSTDKWIRLAYGLKARFMLHTTKKASFNAQAVLDALSKGPLTDDQSTIIQYVDEGPTVTDGSKEALQYSNLAVNSAGRFTKLYMDYLSNAYTGAPTGANNVPDPRIDSIIPRMQTDTGWLRTKGMDMASSLPAKGPANAIYNTNLNKFNSPDSIYIPLLMNPYSPAPGQRIVSTGSWYTRRGGKGLLLTNAEMRFIEAEVQFRQGKVLEALTAYKAGIRSHMNILKVPAAKIDEFLSSTSVVQDPATLTLSHIMIQKYIAMTFSPENFADMRRNNYCADNAGNYNEISGIYKGFKRPGHLYTQCYPNATDYPRRFAMASYEINYNVAQLLKADPNAGKPEYITEPVWWDKP